MKASAENVILGCTMYEVLNNGAATPRKGKLYTEAVL